MEFLPSETIECIAVYLALKDAKSLSRVSRQCYNGTLKRIWSYPKFRKRYLPKSYVGNPRFKIPIVAVKDISHLPIRRLYSSDLKDFDTFYVKELPFTIKEICIDAPLTSDTSLAKFKGLSIKVKIFSDILKNSRLRRAPITSGIRICQILESMNNVMVLTGSKICCCDVEGLDYYDLKNFHRIPFSVFNTNHLRDIWGFEKYPLIDVLTSMKIQELHMVSLKASCRRLEFTKNDLLVHMKDMKIVKISNALLKDDDSCLYGEDHPWIELSHFKALHTIHFIPGTSINLWNLKRFNFIAVKIGSENAKMPVNDIVTLRKMFENGSMYSRIATIGPTWTFRVYLEVTIFLGKP